MVSQLKTVVALPECHGLIPRHAYSAQTYRKGVHTQIYITFKILITCKFGFHLGQNIILPDITVFRVSGGFDCLLSNTFFYTLR